MRKKTIGLLVALSMAVTGIAFAATTKCEVVSINGDTVVMNCGSKASQLTVGQKVKVKTKSKTAAIEGC